MNYQQEALSHWHSLARHTPLGILCDLDGTLLPFTATPFAPELTPDLIKLLTNLAGLPGMRPAVVSGRSRDHLERLLGPIPNLWLIAEHGAWRYRGAAWENAVGFLNADLQPLADSLHRIADMTPGALVERKTWSVTIHYRLVSELERAALLVAVTAVIDEWLSGTPGFERLDGAEMIEVRLPRVRKSLAVPWLRDELGTGARLLALGDDLTDEDMFRELGVYDEPVLVGAARRSRARWRLDDPAAVIALLEWLVAVRRGEEAAPDSLPQPLVPQAHSAAGARDRFDLLIVSNRLPDVRRATEPAEPDRKRNVGGLVSAMEPILSARHGLWLGWSGRTLAEEEPAVIGLEDDSRPAIAWLDFPDSWYRHYYNGFCNRTLWPLFHTFPHHVTFADSEWDSYQQVNRAFATAVTELVAPETPVWFHDYHLLLAAKDLHMLGHRGPTGLFLHIPFPAPDLFALLPWAEQLLDGMLDFDLIGFHTANDVENFRNTARMLSPAQVSYNFIEHRGRRVTIRAFPIGIMPETFRAPDEPASAEVVGSLLRSIAPSRLVLGVDRLDYTKGIPERLEAFGCLLERYPEWRGRVSLVQISVPSRADVPEYIDQRQRVENIVGRINGEYGEADWVPVRYLYRSYSPAQLAALYRAADIGYVTPLRDGMNLVAKEFVAAQDPANPGVLLLSRFAGAAAELRDAVLTNPWHAEGVARDLDRALRMGLAERQERHQRLMAVVSRATATTWAEDFLEALSLAR